MYEIIGGDGKEYGPVPFDELQAWVREGRVSPETMVRRDGGGWVPFREMSEFHSTGGPVETPASPGAESASPRAAVAAPATALLIVGIVHLVTCVTPLQNDLEEYRMMQQFVPPEWHQSLAEAFGQSQVVDFVIRVLSGIVMIVASLRLRALKGYGWAIAGFLLAILPCTDNCFCIGIPIGIWGLVVLSRPEVREAIR